MNSALFLALRRMRAPLLTLIGSYAVSILGMVLIPGVDGEGMPWRVSFFHAFYFISYTATTIGFGELPYAFTDAQRLWITFTIYLTVVAWFYAIGKILQITQDASFQQVLAAERFRRAVDRMGEPFHVVCGYGETGSALVDALDQRGVRSVVIDLNPARVGEVELAALQFDVPALAGDVRQPDTLTLAGLNHPACRGVVALTNDDHANLAVAAAAKLLSPGLTVICRCESDAVAASMAAFGADHVIDPFSLFGEHLATAVRTPGHYLLREWLTAAPDEKLREPLFAPVGRWVLCGFGRFGVRTARGLETGGNAVTIVDADAAVAQHAGGVCGSATDARVLEQAGIREAVGVIAGTGDDVTNLSITQMARRLAPGLFAVVRRNQRSSAPLFDAAAVSVVVQPAAVVVHACLATLMAPLLARFLLAAQSETNAWANELLARIAGITEERVPEIWSLRVDQAHMPAVVDILERQPVPLGGLLADPQSRLEDLPVIALALEREGALRMLPAPDTPLEPGDRMLFCGRGRGRRRQVLTTRNANVLRYVLTGVDLPGGWIWRRLWRADRSHQV
jgi:Trk K+ transport system NAD-binding subunit